VIPIVESALAVVVTCLSDRGVRKFGVRGDQAL
jgi:hypothetical protein